MVGKYTQYCACVPSLSQLSPPPPPPLKGAVGWPRRAQGRVASANGPRATWPQGQLCIQGNVPSGGVSIYMIFPIPSLSECRPPLTMCVGCDMAGRPCSPSPPCCSVGPLGRRGLSGRRTLLEVRHSLTTRQVRRWHRKASIDYELTFPCPVWHPHGSPPLLSPSVG